MATKSRRTRPRAFVYVLQSPKGKLIRESLAFTRELCWNRSFNAMSVAESEFVGQHWRMWPQGQAAARKRGWRVVRAELRVKDG